MLLSPVFVMWRFAALPPLAATCGGFLLLT